MNTQALIDRLDAQDRQRHRDQLMAAAGHAVAHGSVWAPGLARDLRVSLSAAHELLNQLIAQDVCQVRYQAHTANRSVVDSYPVSPDFLDRCRTYGLDLSDRSGTDALAHATHIATRVLSTQE